MEPIPECAFTGANGLLDDRSNDDDRLAIDATLSKLSSKAEPAVISRPALTPALAVLSALLSLLEPDPGDDLLSILPPDPAVTLLPKPSKL